MALYTISDLHLPLGVDKPMNIFGSAWENYVERLRDNWQSVVSDEDTVVLGGDFSWATYLDEARADFEFIDKLRGRKILLKGNHDYWWETATKLRKYVVQNAWENIFFLHNNFYTEGDIAICGTRGWVVPQLMKNADDKRIYERELGRLRLSVESAKKSGAQKIYVFLHYPPVLADRATNPMTKFLEEEHIECCYFGHIHKSSVKNAFCGTLNSVEYRLCSGDYLGFMPIKIT